MDFPVQPYGELRPGLRRAYWPTHRPGTAQAVGAEVALVRAQLAAVEPRADPLGARGAPGVLPLARPRQRAGDASAGPARARAARPARAQRLAHRDGARA